jgi:hypothetical protein
MTVVTEIKQDAELMEQRRDAVLDYALDLISFAESWPDRFAELVEKEGSDWRWQLDQIASGRSLHQNQRSFGPGAGKKPEED